MVWFATTGLLLLLEANIAPLPPGVQPENTGREVPFLQVTVDEGGQLRLGNRADLGGLDLPVFEQHQGRDTAYAVLGRGGRVFVDVELGNLELGAVFPGYFLEHRPDHLAGAAPLGPKIDRKR